MRQLSECHRNYFGILKLLLCVGMSLASFVSMARAQERSATWSQDLAALQSLSSQTQAEQSSLLQGIRTDITGWMRIHPEFLQGLPPEPSVTLDSKQLDDYVDSLRNLIQQISERDPDHPFHLGEEQVSVVSAVSPLSPVADTITQSELEERHATELGQAADSLPGISLQHYSSRNQVGIYLRGFDTRQVPLYIDGIPIYMPYDGQTDYKRFVTGNIAEVQVAKGYTSALLGPNVMGGAVNLVTRQPTNRFEVESHIGTHTGDGLDSGAYIGARAEHYFLFGELDWTQEDSTPLPGAFKVNTYQPTHRRERSYSRDERYSGRVGWTPNANSEYVFSYITQKANYGVPPYAGVQAVCASGQSDSVAARCDSAKYWTWPLWDKTSYYLLANLQISGKTYLKLRSYFDYYPTQTNEYNDETYSSMTSSGNTGIVRYDDHTYGGSAVLSTEKVRHNQIGISLHFKDDTHREGGVTGNSSLVNLQGDAEGLKTAIPIWPNSGGGGGGGGSSSTSYVQPWRTDRDQLWALGMQDVVTLSKKLQVTGGISISHLHGLQAQNFNLSKNTVVPFSCQLFPQGATYADCTAYFWKFDPSAAVSYALSENSSVYGAVSSKSRYSMLKERYSGRLGQALPNPDLGPENATNWTAGYSRAMGAGTVAQIDLFRSDIRNAIENAVVNVTDTVYASLCSTPAACKVFVNVGQETRQGVEFTVRSTSLSHFVFDFNYGFLNRTSQGGVTTTSIYAQTGTVPVAYLTGTPKHKLVATAVVRFPHRFNMSATGRFVSGVRYQLDGSSVTPAVAPSWFVVDLSAKVPFFRHASLRFGVKNLFDHLYYYQEGYPEPGRSLYVASEYRF
ncbi:MAG: TonB-dependent receptor [Acidobacteriota bacterium]|nr:TonB-dependent receptor [Acidobacteriota bacterium]